MKDRKNKYVADFSLGHLLLEDSQAEREREVGRGEREKALIIKFTKCLYMILIMSFEWPND